ncbi:NUDIX domain-containing protein [Geomonas sp.]|uniref:NUDIX domain-containing protein n=1 Tax=Geomonas sp. TaxID=2651584 RepID=UPI002B473B25|nr:NUDIX domain-containing protein [Geomonas sp.]HJV35969.1 NUDIX domain-containing protein [Geomonas sp.]
MYQRNSYCSWCGTPYQQSVWPRECAHCGNRIYLNPVPVVVVLVPVIGGLIGIRRNIEPCKGTITLPGGYLDLGESWQEGGKRELREETGIDLAEGDLKLYDALTGLDGTLLIFSLAGPQPAGILKPFSSKETREVVLIDRPMELGFEMHTKVVARYFGEIEKGQG